MEQPNVVPFKTLLKYTINDCYNDIVKLKNMSQLKEQSHLLQTLGLARHRLLKLLALKKTPIPPCMTEAYEFVDKQDFNIETCANELYNLHLEYRKTSLPSLDLQAAIDILTTGKYRQLPLILNNTRVKIDKEEQSEIIEQLDSKLQVQLFCRERLDPALRSQIEIADGKILVKVAGLYQVKLSLLVGTVSWRLLNLEIHSDITGDTNSSAYNISEFQKGGLMKQLQEVLDKSDSNRLADFNLHLEQFLMKLKLRIFSEQLKILAKTTWQGLIEQSTYSDYINVKFWECKPAGKSRFKYNLQIIARKQNLGGLELQITDLTDSNFKKNLPSSIFQDSKSMEQLMNIVTNQIAGDTVETWNNYLKSANIIANLANGHVYHSLKFALANRILSLELNSRTGVATVQFQDFVETKTSTIQNSLDKLTAALNQGGAISLLNLLQSVENALLFHKIEVLASQLGLGNLPDGAPNLTELKLSSVPTENLKTDGNFLYLKPEHQFSDFTIVMTLGDNRGQEYRLWFVSQYWRAGSLLTTIGVLSDLGLPVQLVSNAKDADQINNITVNKLAVKIPKSITSTIVEYYSNPIFVDIIQKSESNENQSHQSYELKLHSEVLSGKLSQNYIYDKRLKVDARGIFTFVLEDQQAFKHFFEAEVSAFLQMLDVLIEVLDGVLNNQGVAIRVASSKSFKIEWQSYVIEALYLETGWEFNPLAGTVSDSFERWRSEEDLRSCKAAEFSIKTIALFDFYNQMQQLERFFNTRSEKSFKVTYSMDRGWKCRLVFGGTCGFYFQFAENHIVVGDLISCAKEYEPISFYLDSTRKPFPFGILTLLQSIPGSKISGCKSAFDFVSVPLSSAGRLIEDIYTIVDSHICLLLAEQLYQRLGALKVQSIPLTILADFGSKKLGFLVHLKEGLKAGGVGHNNPFTSISNLIFTKAHSIPVKQRYTFEWVESVVQAQNLDASILQDILKMDAMEKCTLELIASTDLGHIKKSQPCFGIDTRANIVHLLVNTFNKLSITQESAKIHIPLSFNYLNQVVWLWTSDEESKSPILIADKKKLIKKLSSYNAQPSSLLGILAKISLTDERLKLSQLAENLISQPTQFSQDDIIKSL